MENKKQKTIWSMTLIPDMKVTWMQMTEIVSKNWCPKKASLGELCNSIPSYFSRMASSNQTTRVK